MTTEGKNISKDVKLSDICIFLKNKRGRARDLARYLGVPLPQLSNWTHGRFAPSGEVMERMRVWMQEADAQEAKESTAADERLRSAINALRKPGT